MPPMIRNQIEIAPVAQARLSGHVYPGETLVIEAWLQEHMSNGGARQVVFRVKTKERGTLVLSHAALVLIQPSPMSRL